MYVLSRILQAGDRAKRRVGTEEVTTTAAAAAVVCM